MKSRKAGLVLKTLSLTLFLGFASVLHAQSGQSATGSGNRDAQVAEQVARGARIWAQHCKRCHNLRNGGELTDEEWEVAVTHMRVRANFPGQLAEDVKVYLKASN